MNDKTKSVAIRLAVLLIAFLPFRLSAKDHVIERGETLESIAKTYGVTTADILEVNPTLKDMFFTGMVISIPEKSTARPDADQNPSEPSSVSTPSSQAANQNSGYQRFGSTDGNSLSSTYGYAATTDSITLPRAYCFLDFLWRVSMSGSGGSFGERSSYGVGVSGYFKTYKKLYLGFELLYSMNLGLSDYEYYAPELYLGPGFALNDDGTCFVNVPLGCMFNLVDKFDEHGEKDGLKLELPFVMRPTFHWVPGAIDLNVGFPLSFHKKNFSAAIQIGIGICF